MITSDGQVAHRQLVDHLIESGALGSDWCPAFEAVHRGAFIPQTMWVEGGVLMPLCHTDNPEGWLQLAYADDPVITQVDDGDPAPDGTGRRITSSASMPTVVAQMLAYCDAQPGQRILEIGTGTEYNAALLAHRLGAGNVVTIKIDSGLTRTARCAEGGRLWRGHGSDR
jgi:protein-L-isoaspartate O-methyltransferase